jgi:nitronate monooxygenase
MNRLQTPLTKKLGIRYPLIQAPMAGGVTTPELVAAVSNSGALGSLGAGYMNAEALRRAIAAIRERTDAPFAVNLFIPEPVPVNAERIAQANALLHVYRQELGLSTQSPPIDNLPDFTEQLAVILEEQVPVLSFTFGVLKGEALEAVKQQGIVTIGTATHLLEAIILEESGIDVVVAQGLEAGGHRGTFLGTQEQGLVGTMALLPLLAEHIRIPFVAAGGIMDGRGLAAALAMGAAGAQLGTAFLACPESGAHPRYKELLCEGTEITTVLTRAFSGKLARGLKNRFTQEMAAREAELPLYPIQHCLTTGLRQAAATQERTEFMSLWAGQGCPLCTARPAAELVGEWIQQTARIFGLGGD